MFSCCQRNFFRTLTNSKFVCIFVFAVTTFVTTSVSFCQTEENERAASRIVNVAVNAQNQQDYGIALKEWQKVIRDFPKSSYFNESHYYAGICQQQLGQDESAIDSFRTALKLLDKKEKVKRSNALFLLGYCLQNNGRKLFENGKTDEDRKTAKIHLTSATKSFSDLQQTHPDFPDLDQAFYFQGNAFELLGRLNEAAASFENSLKQKGTRFRFDSLFALANVNERLGRFDVALERYIECETEANQAEGGNPLLTEVRYRKAITLIELANSSSNLGDSQTANKYWDQASQILANVRQTNGFPLINEAVFEHAKLFSIRGDYKNAVKLFAQVADTDSEFASVAAVRAGRDLIRLKRYDEATRQLQSALINKDRQSDVAAHWMAQIFLKTNQAQKAEEFTKDWLKKTQSDNPLRPSLMLDLGDAVYAQNEYLESAKHYMDLVNEFSDHELAPTALYNAAFSEFKAGNFENAEKLTAEFRNKTPKNHSLFPDAMVLNGDALAAQKKYAKAAQAYQDLTTQFANHPEVDSWYLNLALALYQQNQPAKLIELIQPRIASMTTEQQGEALHWIGLSYSQQKNFQKAADYFSRALKTSRDYSRVDETLLALAQSQRQLGQGDMANATLDELKKTQSDSRLVAEALYRKGESGYNAENFAVAKEAFSEIVSQHPKSSFAPFAEYKLGWSQVRLGNLKEAQSSFSRFLANHKEHKLVKSALLARAMCLREQKNLQPAILDLDAAMKLNLTADEKKDATFEKGLCLIGLQDWKSVKTIFSGLIESYGDSTEAPSYFYELAWAHMYLNEKDLATQQFGILASRFPKHRLAAEANFHVGNSLYEANEFSAAITAYTAATSNSSIQPELREKAVHKLGWAHYKSKAFDQAEKVFGQQIGEFQKGVLSADAKVMLAECQMQLKKYKEATESYRVAKPAVRDANIDPNFRWITYLHGAQAANQSKQFDLAIEFANEIVNSNEATRSYKFDAYLELGNAFYGKKDNEKAVEAWTVAEENDAKTGARARCMIGDVLMGQKKFDDAIAKFKMVVYDFGGLNSVAEVKPWQAFASYEIARCYFSQIQSETDAKQKSMLVENSMNWFNYLIKNYPDDQLRPQAEKQIRTLKQFQRK